MQTSKSVHIAIDLGASSGRIICGIYMGNNLKLDEVHRFKNTPITSDGLICWDIKSIYNNIIFGINKATNIYGDNIFSIGIDSWAVDFVLLDKNDNYLFYPRHYRNERNTKAMEYVTKLLGRDYIYNQTGIQFMPINTLYQLYAEKSSPRSQIHKAKTLLFIPDLINFWLTGIKTAELTNASTSQLYDPTRKQWSSEILNKLEIPISLLPKISPPGTILGSLKRGVGTNLNLTKTKVALTATHDTASAVAAIQNSKEINSVFISSGTWSLVGIQSDKPIINNESLKFGFTNEIGFNGNIRFLKNVTGMWLIQECIEGWKSQGFNYSIENLVDSAQNANKLQSFLDPDHDTFQTHGHMPEKLFRYLNRTNQELPNTHAELIRIIFKSIAFKYKHTIDNLSHILGDPIEKIRVVGGGANNYLLNQMCANITGLEVSAGPIEATATGNILGQLIATATLPSLEVGHEMIEKSFQSKIYYPMEVDNSEYDYSQFIKILSKPICD
ncbi:MAG: rhamnulokinase [Chloroflexi bacterium]|nr:rhamnulokinase [Chloroflexota bacterium]